MTPNQVKELVGLIAERSSAWQALWTVFFTVGTGILGLFASGTIIPRYRSLASWIAAAGFLLFASGNYIALSEARLQRQALSDYVYAEVYKAESKEMLAFVSASKPPEFWKLSIYHWGLSIFVVSLIFVIPRVQARAEKT